MRGVTELRYYTLPSDTVVTILKGISHASHAWPRGAQFNVVSGGTETRRWVLKRELGGEGSS